MEKQVVRPNVRHSVRSCSFEDFNEWTDWYRHSLQRTLKWAYHDTDTLSLIKIWTYRFKKTRLKGNSGTRFSFKKKKKLYLDPIGNEEKKVSQHFFAFAKIFVKNVSADHADTTKKRGHDKETRTSTANVEGFSQIVREQSGKKVLECNNLEIWILLT